MRKLINNQRFTIQFCFIMKGLGIKTVGGAKKFLDRCSPNIKIQNLRVNSLQKELKSYLNPTVL